MLSHFGKITTTQFQKFVRTKKLEEQKELDNNTPLSLVRIQEETEAHKSAHNRILEIFRRLLIPQICLRIMEQLKVPLLLKMASCLMLDIHTLQK